MITKTTRILLIGLSFSLALTSCNDYLDTTNERIVPAHEQLTDLKALQATTASIYAQPWYYFHKQRFLMLGDARANNIYNSSSNIGELNAQATLNEERLHPLRMEQSLQCHHPGLLRHQRLRALLHRKPHLLRDSSQRLCR